VSTYVSYTVNQNNRQHPGVRAVEPAVDDAYAVRGKLYVALELFPVRPSEAGAPQPAYSGALIANTNNQVLAAVQHAYYSAKGSHLQVVQAALQNGQQTLRAINTQQPAMPLRAGIGAVALLGNRLVVATCGPIISLLASNVSIQQFPSEASTELVGVAGQPDPEIQTYQHTMSGDNALFLGSSAWLTYVAPRELLGIVAHLSAENSQEAAHYLSQQSRFATIPGLFLCAGVASSKTATSSSLATNQAGTNQAGVTPSSSKPSVQPQSFGGLPTSVHATTRSQPVQGQPHPSASQSVLNTAIASTPSTENQANQMGRASAATRPSTPTDARTHTHATEQREPVRQSIAAERAALERVPKNEVRHQDDGHQVNQQVRDQAVESAELSHKKRSSFSISSMIGQVGAAFDRLLKPLNEPVQEGLREKQVDAGYVESTASTRDNVREQMISEAEYRESKGWSSESIAEPLYIEPVPSSGGRARLFLAFSAMIFFLVPVVVFASVASQGASTRARTELMINEAAAKIKNAEAALDAGNNGAASTELNEAQRLLIEAESQKGDRSRISQLSARMRQNFQAVSVVVPFYMLVDPLVRFAPDASPASVMVVNQDVYVLDRGRNHIVRFRLGPNGKTIPDPAGEVVLRQGDRIDGFEVGPLIDMAWQTPSVGNEEKSNLIVLDSNNQIFRYNQVVDGPGRLEFGNQALWQSPTQIQSYLGRFYVADSGRGQIYRYSPGAFDAEPDEWLAAATSLSLSSLLSMVIDGDIWMLFSNGQLVRYHNGLTVPFALDDDVGKITEPVDMFIGDQEDSLIYIADAGGERILVYRKDGSYLRQHQADEGTPLRGLRGIFVDEITNNIYILTQSSLYQHPLAE